MKKFLALLLAACMLLPFAAMAETAASPSADAATLPAIKLSQVQWAAHGTKCFAVITVAMLDDVIVAAYIDEYQVGADMVGVPNSENGFGGFTDGKVLYSKRVNSEAYSANMQKAGSTVALADNYAFIEAYVAGMTVSELEAAIAGFGGEATAAVDAVSGATLVDTLGYLQGILAAAKAAQ